MSLDADVSKISLNDNGPSERTINSADYELFELFDINQLIEKVKIFCFSR